MNRSEQLEPARSFNCVKVGRETSSEEAALVATEVPFTIVANGIELATFLCSPSDLSEMTIGFLFTSGFIAGAREVKSLQLDFENWKARVWIENPPDAAIINKRMYTSGCGRGVTYASASELPSELPLDDEFKVGKLAVLEIMKWFQGCSDLHRETHGVHTAAVSHKGEIPALRFDDVGRHNAVDKIAGRMLMDGMSFGEKILLTSGRVSSEIVHKAVKCRFPVISSLSSATHQAILMAQVMNVTLLCFAKGGKFSIFAGGERIML